MPARTYPKLADRKTLIAKARTVHRSCGQRWVTVNEFCKLAGISRYRVTRCFDSYGDLLRAPVNEQGVVFLFATLAVDLGYLIDSLTSEFPDCEAKRRVGNAWEKVRIEFEYESRNFAVHAHDPEGCDLIVCWEHNWSECPIEVLELRQIVSEINRPNALATAAQSLARA